MDHCTMYAIIVSRIHQVSSLVDTKGWIWKLNYLTASCYQLCCRGLRDTGENVVCDIFFKYTCSKPLWEVMPWLYCRKKRSFAQELAIYPTTLCDRQILELLNTTSTRSKVHVPTYPDTTTVTKSILQSISLCGKPFYPWPLLQYE